jgi:regulator of replication initiation timing
LKEEIKKQFGCNNVQELIDHLNNIETKNESLQVEINKLSERLTDELNKL